MPIEFFCEHCQSKLRTPDETAGKRVRCPKCGNISSIPTESLASSPQAPEPSTREPGAKPENITSGDIASGSNPYSSPTIDQYPSGYGPHFRTSVSRESIRSRVLSPGIALIVANSIAFLGGLLILAVAIIALANGRRPSDEAIGQFGASFYVLVMSGISVAGGIAMTMFKYPSLALAASITSILNGLCCCTFPIAFGIWALVVLLDHDVRSHYT